MKVNSYMKAHDNTRCGGSAAACLDRPSGHFSDYRSACTVWLSTVAATYSTLEPDTVIPDMVTLLEVPWSLARRSLAWERARRQDPWFHRRGRQSQWQGTQASEGSREISARRPNGARAVIRDEFQPEGDAMSPGERAVMPGHGEGGLGADMLSLSRAKKVGVRGNEMSTTAQPQRGNDEINSLLPIESPTNYSGSLPPSLLIHISQTQTHNQISFETHLRAWD